jgi:hypothetical protein
MKLLTTKSSKKHSATCIFMKKMVVLLQLVTEFVKKKMVNELLCELRLDLLLTHLCNRE